MCDIAREVFLGHPVDDGSYVRKLSARKYYRFRNGMEMGC